MTMRLEAFGGCPGVLKRLARREISLLTRRPRRWRRCRALARVREGDGGVRAATGDDGTLTGIIDWEGACAGDPRFDLVRFAYDLDGHDQPVWDVVEATGIEPRVLRAYVAHHALRCTSWQIHHHTDDVPRQLDRAERVLDRYEA